MDALVYFARTPPPARSNATTRSLAGTQAPVLARLLSSVSLQPPLTNPALLLLPWLPSQAEDLCGAGQRGATGAPAGSGVAGVAECMDAPCAAGQLCHVRASRCHVTCTPTPHAARAGLPVTALLPHMLLPPMLLPPTVRAPSPPPTHLPSSIPSTAHRPQVVDLLCISDAEATRALRFYKWDLGKLQVQPAACGGAGCSAGWCLKGGRCCRAPAFLQAAPVHAAGVVQVSLCTAAAGKG